MRPGKILIGQVAIVFVLIVLTNWAATQWAAHQFEYQGALGRPWMMIGDQPIYKPWRLFQWWYAYEAYAPDVFARAGLIAASGGLIGIFAAVVGSVVRSRDRQDVTTFGSARWATRDEIKSQGLLDNEGVFLGQIKNAYLRHDGPEHVMAFAPTRSGKGVGLVVPTLLTWTGSVVVHDIKGENWDLTSGWRSQFSRCVRFDPTDYHSPGFNPLLEIRKGLQEVQDAQNIADILVDPMGTLEDGGHWKDKARELLVATILHVLYVEDDKTLAGCAAFLSNPERSIQDTLKVMLETKHKVNEAGEAYAHPDVAQTARQLLDNSPNERSGILSTTQRFLSLYRDPIIANVTSRNDWRIADLMEGDAPLSLYLACPPSDLSRTKPLMRLILNQIARRLTEKLPKNSARKLLLMLDEFPALGRLEFFESTLAYFAGYGVRAYLIAQSLNQIEKAYGPSNSILDHCHIRVAFATNDERTAKRISEALGTKTELRAQKNYTGHRLAPWLSHMMVSRQETQRSLMTPGEIMQLPRDDAIIMLAGMPPARGNKLRYYQDRNFMPRIMTPPERLLEAPSKRPENEINCAHPNSLSGAANSVGCESEVSKVRSVREMVTQHSLKLEPVEIAGDKIEAGEEKREEEDLRKVLVLDQSLNNSMPEQ
jgi:type IV secretion system protein VirD4